MKMPDFNEELTRKFEEEASTSAQEEAAARGALATFGNSLVSLDQTIPDFNDTVMGNGYREKISTGFDGIDRALNGGLTKRLYLISADTSMGKSTLVWNIAENIARNTAAARQEYDTLPEEDRKKTKPPKRQSVLYFLMEMTAEELTARAISRRMLEANEGKADKDIITPLTEDQILTQYNNPDEVTSAQQAAFTIAEHRFITDEAPYIYIIQGRKNVEDIALYVHAFMERENRQELVEPPPVVIIDYLQIMAPTIDQNGRPLFREPRLQVDHNTKEIEKIIYDYGTPVILISSVTKQAQGNLVIDMTALKESGEISYNADVVITMNIGLTQEAKEELKKAESKAQDQRNEARKNAKETSKRAYPRRLELTFEKNRGAVMGIKVPMLYYAAHNAFFDDPEDDKPRERVYKPDEIRPPQKNPF